MTTQPPVPWPRRFAGRLVTGPAAFGLAGALDMLVILRLLVRYKLSERTRR